jgi:phosphoglycerate dehydrogenase-like enzyme
MPTVLIADCDHGSIEPECRLLEPAGVEVRLGGGSDADVLIVQFTRVDGPLLDRMPSCRAVTRHGVDTIDVDAAAVLDALRRGRLAGVALDVFEHEPPEGAERDLVSHPRAIATPHAAWRSRESQLALKTEVAREVLRVLEGRRPRSPVNEPKRSLASDR